MLIAHALSVLRSTPVSDWDAVGYSVFESRAIFEKVPEADRLPIWKKALAIMHGARSKKFFAYVKAGGLYAGITVEQMEREKNASIETEVEEWSDARFRIVERISDTITFKTMDDKDFDVSTDSLFSQSDFRKAYFKGTNKMLPEIGRKAYQKFIERLPFTVVEGFSQNKKEIIADTLREMVQRLSGMESATEKEALILVLSKGRALYDTFLFFKLHDLIGELRQHNRPYELQTVAVGLKYLDARQVHTEDGNYWIYDFKSKAETEEEEEIDSTPLKNTPVDSTPPEPPPKPPEDFIDESGYDDNSIPF